MNKILEKITVISSQFDNNNSPVDIYCIDKIVNQLKQTMVREIHYPLILTCLIILFIIQLLELSIASNLSAVNDDNGYISNGNHLVLDNDVMVTLLACYTYPPYIDFKEVEALIAL